MRRNSGYMENLPLRSSCSDLLSNPQSDKKDGGKYYFIIPKLGRYKKLPVPPLRSSIILDK